MYTVNEDYRLKRIAALARGAGSVVDLGFADMPNFFLDNGRVTGVDPAADAKPPNYTDIFRGTLQQYLDAGGEPPDAVTAGELIEHLEDPIGFLRECHAALKSGGKLILSTPNPNSPLERLLTLSLNRRFFYTSDHLILFPQRWLIRIMEYAGFSKVKLYSGGFPLPVLGTVPFFRPWCHQTIAVAEKPS